jgi:hypothetical protein
MRFCLLLVSKFYKIRAKLMPPNPKSFNFKMPPLYTTTHSGKEFLIYDSTHKKLSGRLMIFSTKVLIKMLCSCETILVDGTFKTRPVLFFQVYVIIGQHLDEGIYVFSYGSVSFMLFLFSNSIGMVSDTKTKPRCLR